MKKLVLLLVLGMAGPLLFAQNSYTSFQLRPQVGQVHLPTKKLPARAFQLEYNLGKHLRKGFALETGLGLRTQGIRFRCRGHNNERNTVAQQATMAVLPARLRLRLNSRTEGRKNLWLNLGYVYGHRLFADGWILTEPESGLADVHEELVRQRSFHFAEAGLELDVPLGTTHRLGFGINYTRSLTPGSENSYFRSFLSLPGFSIRIARRRWSR